VRVLGSILSALTILEKMKTTKKDILIFCFVLAAIPIFLYRNILVYYLLVAIDLAPVPHVLYDEIFGVNSYDRASIKKYIDPLTMKFYIKPAGTAGDWTIYKVTDKDTIIFLDHFESPERICDGVNPYTYDCGESNW